MKLGYKQVGPYEIYSLEELAENGIDIEYVNPRAGIYFNDGTHLSKEDNMVVDMINVMQPQARVDVYRGDILVDGNKI